MALLACAVTSVFPEDRNAMAFSVENRVPFLTTDLLHFVFSLPEEEIISAEGRCKAVLLRAMRGLVPMEVLDRRDNRIVSAVEKRRGHFHDDERRVPVLADQEHFRGLIGGSADAGDNGFPVGWVAPARRSRTSREVSWVVLYTPPADAGTGRNGATRSYDAGSSSVIG